MSANDDTYAYDSRGNITSKTESGTTTTFTYSNSGWKDQLVSVNGVDLTYDANGNVLTYDDKEYTWNTGRNLATITDSSNNDSISYTYNRYGYRTSKTVSGVTTHFTVDENGTVVAQKTGNDTLYFEYDKSGTPLGFVYNGVQYLYVTSISNDIIAIADSTGTIVASYTYGDWGECTVDSTSTNLALANLNPLRYRGYYYDNETGYYYLQSRYYDPSICRFINSDLPEYAQMQKDDYAGINIFTYCNNDAVNNCDFSGNSKYSIVAVGLQLEFSASLFGYSGEVGIEFIYVFSKNCVYAYAYGGIGGGGGFGKKGIQYFKSSFKDIVMSPKVSLKNICNMFKLNTSFSAGLFIVKTTSGFKWPNGYCGSSTSSTMTIHKVKGYYGKGNNCKTYGICYSTGVSFCFGKTAVYYQKVDAIYNKVKNYLSAQRRNIIDAIA